MFKVLFLFLLYTGFLLSQTVFEPANSSVYNFLNRLSLKNIIVFNDELRPVSRMLIAEKLIEAECNLEELTAVERKELLYYKKDFEPEVLLIRNSDEAKTIIFKDDADAGFRPFFYRDKNFTFSADPVLGFSYSRQYNDDFTQRFNGLMFNGYYHNVGFNFYFRDNEENGKTIDYEKRMTRTPGIVPHKKTVETMDYSYVRGTISYSWDWGSIELAKDYINWGSGRDGQLILSSKAPSFPYIGIIFSPVKWIQFRYIHGWLRSGVVDSNSVRTTLVEGRDSYRQVDKFIAAHIISLYPSNNFSFSIGESIIYSDQLEPVYLIPVIFFRLADHYNSDTGDNAQVFANAVYKYFPFRAKIYSTLFIDELSLTNLFKGGNLSSVGLTVGLNLVDPFVDNSEVVVEYTRVDPFVYMNSNNVQLYTSHGYQLGHWIGSNADQLYFSFKQWIMRGLSIQLWGEYVRKGQTELPQQQYELPYPPMLYGPDLKMVNAGINAEYAFLQKLFARVFYQYSHITDEEQLRIPEFKIAVNHSFGLTVSFGM